MMPRTTDRHDQRALTRVGMALCFGLLACQTNQSGRLAALEGGDRSRPAVRGSPVAALRAACGEGAVLPAGAAIRRRPYLQQVTASSAMIGWVTSSTAAARIEATSADGSEQRAAVAEADTGALRGPGEYQMWARLDGLRPDTIYCYALLDAAGELVQRTGFRTAPAADAGAPIRFMVFGDSGGIRSEIGRAHV